MSLGALSFRGAVAGLNPLLADRSLLVYLPPGNRLFTTLLKIEPNW